MPPIRAKLTVDGVVTVVDGAAVAAGRFADDPEALLAQREEDQSIDHDNPLEEVYEDQLLCADLVILNKADLMSKDEIASVTKRPESVIGLHFFSPANVMRLLEIVRAAKTAPDVIATALDLGRRLVDPRCDAQTLKLLASLETSCPAN